MYKFLTSFLPKSLANIMIDLWYFFLIMFNLYCGIAVAQGAFQYVGWWRVGAFGGKHSMESMFAKQTMGNLHDWGSDICVDVIRSWAILFYINLWPMALMILAPIGFCYHPLASTSCFAPLIQSCRGAEKESSAVQVQTVTSTRSSTCRHLSIQGIKPFQ